MGRLEILWVVGIALVGWFPALLFFYIIGVSFGLLTRLNGTFVLVGFYLGLWSSPCFYSGRSSSRRSTHPRLGSEGGAVQVCSRAWSGWVYYSLLDYSSSGGSGQSGD